jgi:hypothetical protein
MQDGESILSLPVIVSAFVLLGGTIATGIFTIINKRGDNKASKEPTLVQVWERMNELQEDADRERKARLRIEDKLRKALRVIAGYIDRVQHGGDVGLTTVERAVLENETSERQP